MGRPASAPPVQAKLHPRSRETSRPSATPTTSAPSGVSATDGSSIEMAGTPSEGSQIHRQLDPWSRETSRPYVVRTTVTPASSVLDEKTICVDAGYRPLAAAHCADV